MAQCLAVPSYKHPIFSPMRATLLAIVLVITLSAIQAQSLVTAEIFHGNDSQITPTVTTDSEQNIICATGFWANLDADPGPGTLLFTAFGSQDVAITKLDPSGNLIWSRQLGGTGFETPQVIKTDAADNIFVFGYFNGTIDMNPGPGVYNLVSAGGDDVYCGKYDPNGNLLWAVRTGGTGTEQAYGFDLDNAGNAVVTGYFQSTVDFDPGLGTSNLTAGPSGSDFLLKLNSDGSFSSVLLMGSFYTNCITIDNDNNIYFTGLFWGTVDFNPGVGTYNISAEGFGADAFILKLNNANVFQWAGKISGNNSEQGTTIVYDEISSSVIVGGFFEGTIDIDPSATVQNIVSLGYIDAFIAKYNSIDGALIWGKSVGGIDYQAIGSLTVNSSGNIWATGTFNSTVDFDPGADTHSLTSAGGTDIFKLNWDTNGNFIEAGRIGNTFSDYGQCITIDNQGAVIISGIFEGIVDFDPGDITFNLNSEFTGWDGYIAKYCTVYTINNNVSICEGGSYFVGGANQTEPGDYYDYYTPIEGCDSIIITHLSINNPTVNLGADVAICNGTMLTLNAGNPGSTYLWNTGATTQTINVSTAGTYSVTITTPEGCTASDAITITVNPSPNVNLGADISACADEAVVLNAGNPGATYLWSTGANTQTINALTTGTYSVVVTNAFGCTDADIINVTIHALPIVNIGNTINYCTGENVTLDAGNVGSTYLWSTGATTQTITTATPGTYTVTVTNAFGCDAADNATLVEHALPIINLGEDITTCADDIITLNALNPGASYLWNTGATTPIINVTESGNYSVTVTNGFGCSNSDLINITINPLPEINLGTTINFCENTSVILDAENAGSTYLWNTGATTQIITTAIPATYSVTVTNVFGCLSYDEVVLNELPAPEINLGTDTGFCAGSSFTLDATSPDVTYLWNTGETTATLIVEEAGSYVVAVTNIFGCTNADSIIISTYATPVVNLGEDEAYCSGDEVYLDATNPDANYLWNTGDTTSTIYVTESGYYSVNVTNGFGCATFDDINITIHPLPIADLGPDTTICEYADLLLDATTPFCSYLWNTGATTPTIIVNEEGLYTVSITNSFGCYIIDSIIVNILSAPIVTLTLPFIEICSNIDPVTLTGGSPAGGAYSGDGVADNIFNPLTAGIGTHEIAYNYTDANGCSATAIETITVTVCQGVELNNYSSILIYPNPAIENLTIKNNSLQTLQNIIITNLLGEIVLRKDVVILSEQTINVNINVLPGGSYIIRIGDNFVTPLIISK